MAHRLVGLLFVLVALVVPRVAAAAPPAEPGPAVAIDPKKIPDDLRPWTDWVLSKKPAAACPTMVGSEERTCAWPSSLDLRVDEKTGRFAQRWHVEVRQRVPLPGGAKRWPLDVKVGATRGVVVADGAGVPTVELPPGDHEVTGAFAWDSPPESLEVPPATGLLTLTLRGAAVPSPNRDEGGRVFLSKTAAAEADEKLDIVVHRKVTDDTPLLLTTRIELSVAGKNREVLLGKALPPGFVPLALETPIPARVEPDGRLRVQARAGTFNLYLTARSEAPVARLARPVPDGPWREGDEVWVFEAKNDLRVVTVEGVPAIDPQQTTLLDAWKRLPAYAMKLDAAMTLAEKRRGDADPPPNQLTLVRKLWLDFDGGGFTMTDRITGALGRDTRLEMDPPTVLGRVAIRDANQFITHLGDPSRRGVEVRQGALSATADSRYVGDASDVPAVGWRNDFHQVSGVLHLPPGWRLFHASGADDVPGTWVRHWSLFELFLAIVTALAVLRLYGPAWGGAAAVMLALTYPELDAPKWAWVVLLAFEALSRALPSGNPGRLLRAGRVVSALVLAVVVVPFLVAHVRGGIYPQLAPSAGSASAPMDGEVPLAAFKSDEGGMAGAGAAPGAPPPPPAEVVETKPSPARDADANAVRDEPKAEDVDRRWAGGYAKSSGAKQQHSNAQVYDPSAVVQTGPGLPTWSWSSIELRWSGPVDHAQRLHLVLLSPRVNLLLALLRAGLVVLVLLRLFPWPSGMAPFRPRLPPPRASAALLVLLAAWPSDARAAIPSQEMLDELEARLTAKAACAPSCASSSRMLLEARGDVLRARLDIDAAAQVAVPLPGGAAQWSPEVVTVDGKPGRALQRTKDGKLWLLLEPGPHQVLVSGKLPARELVQIALPLRPHRVEASLEGWTLEGLHEDGLADDNLQLTRSARQEGAGATLQPGALPPFLRIERTLRLGLNWQVETRVVRVSEPGSAVVALVPLLPGESVTTADVRVANGHAQLNMSSQATEVSWRSVLEQKSPLRLEAKKGLAATEVWRLDLGPIWHATQTGIPVIGGAASGEARIPEWRPWPGEVVELAITRPEGVTGQSLTIDRARHEVRPGIRATDSTLSLSLRASRGLEHTLVLPEGAELDSVSIAGRPVPLRLDGRKLTLPVSPGAQTVNVAWREPRGLALVYRTPSVDLGTPSVNAETVVTGLGSRWILFTAGPRLGPAVLFWSLLLVLLAVGFALSRITWVPLASWQWMLLAIGLSQIPIVLAAFVVGWLVALGWRREHPDVRGGWVVFDLRQIGLAVLTMIALGVLVEAVRHGLLGSPAMQIDGNRSSADMLAWYADRHGGIPESAMVVSAPMIVYRLAMLAWALWIAVAVLAWLKWGFAAFVTGGGWQKAPLRPPPPPRQAYGPPGVPNPPGAWGPPPPGPAPAPLPPGPPEEGSSGP